MASEAAKKIAEVWANRSLSGPEVLVGGGFNPVDEVRRMLADDIDAAIAAAVQRERDECAAACLSLDHGEPLRGEEAAFVHGSVSMRSKCAAAIRNRKEQPDEK